MGCWGITALESDNGLDAVRCVRYNLPADGQLDLGEMLERLKKDRWNAPCDVKLGCAHTSPMALAEIVVKYLDGDPGSLDYDEEWAAEDNKFRVHHLVYSIKGFSPGTPGLPCGHFEIRQDQSGAADQSRRAARRLV